MFTTPRSSAAAAATTAASGQAPPEVYRGLWHGLISTYRTEGVRGLYRGAGLAHFGVSNGAIQFMAYEELKKWRTSVAARRISDANASSDTNASTASSSAAIDTSMCHKDMLRHFTVAQLCGDR